MLNPIKEIVLFNQKAGLIEAGYDDFLESSLAIEEALEGLKDLPYLATRLHSEGESHEENFTPRECARQITRLARMDDRTPVTDVARLDKSVDAFSFAVGAMAKLRLTPEQITEAVLIVNKANQQKLKNASVDYAGKLHKPENFVGPERELQALLDRRLP